MNKTLYKGFLCLCAGVMLVLPAGCSASGKKAGKAELLGEAAPAESLNYDERGERLDKMLAGAERFARKFAPAARAVGEGENVALSPVSVYMALSLAAECAGGETRQEIVDALGVSYEALKSDFSLFFRSVAAEHYWNSKLISTVAPCNSIWVDRRPVTKEECIGSLSQNYHCTSYAADFLHDNEGANKALSRYVKEKTHGLIDQDFKLSEDTYYALVNALYLKDVWNTQGDDLPFTSGKYRFTASDGSVTETKLLSGYYLPGRAQDFSTFKSFYTRTAHGYTVRFLLPKEGYTANDVFTEENLSLLQEARYDYVGIEGGEEVYYYTRCLFPAFHADFNQDVIPVLQQMGVRQMFREGACDLSALFTPSSEEEYVFVKQVQHVTDLTVNEKGVEGAAVTVIGIDGAESAGPKREVYEDFPVDKNFAFVLENDNGTTLFSGVVNRIEGRK